MYKIISKYKNGQFEMIDSTSCRIEANRLVNEYQMAFGNDFRVEWLFGDSLEY